jgi:predicted RNA-binding protein with PUA-like domain
MPAHWLIKSEPDVYSYARLTEEKKAVWDGIRNFEARNNLRKMAPGDLCLFYHTGDEKAVVGIAKVTKAAYQDPTTDEDWSVVDVAPVKKLAEPVTLAALKSDARTKQMPVVRKPRISVTPVSPAEFSAILALGKTKLA